MKNYNKDLGSPELLPNGLMRVFDYGASWAHLFKKVEGKWKHYAGNVSPSNKIVLEGYINRNYAA